MKKNLMALFLVIVLTGIQQKLQAQKQANHWYFGTGAGIEFTTGVPVAVSNCSPSFSAFEGVGAISDAGGNLLFYTDGNNIFNANHIAMPNGTGLSSNTSSTQTGVIIKQPGNPNLYYVFTNDLGIIYYSIVDMNLQGGLGDVTTKNQLLRSGSTERGTLVRHANGTDFWFISHDNGNDAFVCFPVTASGIGTPVISNTGLTVSNVIGAMKVSPTANKIGVAGFYDNRYELHDFDNSTGIVSNSTASPANYVYAYGCEFSPDGTKLYGGKENSKDLWQFDLNAGANVWNSATLITQTNAQEFEQMSLGPDGKIYCSLYQSGYLGCIQDPNQAGLACNYTDSGVFLLGETCYLGLPQFEPTIFNTPFIAEDVCLGDSTHFTIPYTTGLLGVLWNFDDPLSGPNNSSSVFNATHYYSNAGAYYVQLIEYSAFGNDTLHDTVYVFNTPAPDLGNDTTICNNTFITLDAGAGTNLTYVWSNGSTTQTIQTGVAGTYTVTVSNGACDGTDFINIATIPCTTPVINFSSTDSIFCEKQCIDFSDLSTGNPTSWQWFFTGANPDTSTLQNPTDICYNNYGAFDVMLIACNANGCDTLVITNFITELQNPTDSIWQSNDTLYSLPGQSYQWYELSGGLISGATNSYYVFTQPGSYYCLVNDSVGCVATSNIIVITALAENQNHENLNFIIPNPNNGSFTIELNMALSADANLRIFDMQGRIVYNSAIKNQREKIDSDLSNGSYLCAVNNNGKIYYQRLFIRK